MKNITLLLIETMGLMPFNCGKEETDTAPKKSINLKSILKLWMFCLGVLFLIPNNTNGQDYEPSYAVWFCGYQLGIIEYGAYVNAAPSSLMQNFDQAINMARASGCIPEQGIILLKNRMGSVSSSQSLYNEILTFRQQISTLIAQNCSCVQKANTVNYPNIGGTWYQNGNQNVPCTITQSGQNLSFQMGNNSSQGSFSTTNQVFANSWNAAATLSADGLTLTWADQTWTRRAGSTPGPGGGLVETVSVSAANKGKTASTTVLEQGRSYTIRISGVCSVWGGRSDGLDALYSYNTTTPALWSPFHIDDVALVKFLKSAQKSTAYNSNHVYEITIIGPGRALQFGIKDGSTYGGNDNSGALTVEIFRN